MNDTFSFKRFGLCLRQFVGTNWKLLGVQYLALLAVMVAFAVFVPLIFSRYSSYGIGFNTPGVDIMWKSEIDAFWFIFFVFIMFMAAGMFNNLDSKQKRIGFLTLPASNLEKFFTGFLLFIIMPYITFFISMYIADSLRVMTAHIYADEGAVIKILPISLFLSFGHDYDNSSIIVNELWEVVGTFTIFTQSFFVLCSAIWTKHAFIKGTIAGVCIWLGLILMFVLGFKLLGTGYHATRFTNDDINNDLLTIIAYVIFSIFTIGSYALAYMRFKEMETISRW